MKELLEVIRENCGYTYISDLKSNGDGIPWKRLGRILSPENYSLYEWKDCIAYITGGDASFVDSLEAVDAWLRRQEEKGKGIL